MAFTFNAFSPPRHGNIIFSPDFGAGKHRSAAALCADGGPGPARLPRGGGGEVATAAVAARPSAAPPAAEARPTPERVEGRRAEAAPRAWNVPSAGCQLTPGRRLRAGRCEGEAVAPQGPSPSPSPSPPLNPLPPAGLSAQGRSPRRGRSLRRGRFPARAASARPPAPRRPSPPRCSCASCSGS